MSLVYLNGQFIGGRRVKSPPTIGREAKVQAKSLGCRKDSIQEDADRAVAYIEKHQGSTWQEIREALGFGKAARETLMRHMYHVALFFIDDETGQCYVGKEQWQKVAEGIDDNSQGCDRARLPDDL